MAAYDWSDLAKSVLPGMQTAFMGGYKAMEDKWGLIAQRVPSNQASETYPWVADHGGASEWKGEREPGAGSENYLTVTNLDYEVSWKVMRDALRYEKYGQMQMQAAGRGRVMGNYINELTLTLIASAASTATYTGDDATYVAAADHAEGNSGTQTNLGSTALSDASLTAARVAMMKLKDARGKAIGLVGDTIVVPPDLEKTALTLVQSERIVGNANNDTNVHKGAYQVIVNPFMTDANDWALLCTTGHVRPLIWQEVHAPTPVEILRDDLKINKQVFYGSDMTGRASFTDWRYIYYASVT